MKTDIPLKRLAFLCGADLLPLLGVPAASLVQVESCELPASATRLDTLLHVVSPQGQEYLHVVEFQGYPDPTVLWRLAGYLAWLGQQRPGKAIVGTVVYLAAAYDVGDTLAQVIDGQVVQAWPLRRVRLWEQDAQAALASARPGLVALSPLMRNADAGLVEAAARFLLQQTALPQQDDLLSILGVFAEPLLEPQRFMRLIGRERVMSSGLFEYVMKDKIAEVEAEAEAKAQARIEAEVQQREAELKLQQREAELKLQQREAELRHELQQALADTLLVQFPAAPLALVHDIRRVYQAADLRRLIVAVQQVSDLAAAEQVLREAAAQAGSE